jgi:hypothetical protein
VSEAGLSALALRRTQRASTASGKPSDFGEAEAMDVVDFSQVCGDLALTGIVDSMMASHHD